MTELKLQMPGLEPWTPGFRCNRLTTTFTKQLEALPYRVDYVLVILTKGP